MYHIVYLTTNLVNQKIYVGVHSTYNLNDGYIGSGYTLVKAITKYGKYNFNRKILFYCLSRDEAVMHESAIVDSSFVSRNDTYNLQLGGANSYQRSEDAINNLKLSWTDERKQKHSEIISNLHKSEDCKLYKFKGGSEKGHNKGRKQSEEHIQNRTSKRIGQKHSDEARKKIAEAISYVECPFCHKIVTKTVLTRNHKEKCKMFTSGNHDL